MIVCSWQPLRPYSKTKSKKILLASILASIKYLSIEKILLPLDVVALSSEIPSFSFSLFWGLHSSVGVYYTGPRQYREDAVLQLSTASLSKCVLETWTNSRRSSFDLRFQDEYPNCASNIFHRQFSFIFEYLIGVIYALYKDSHPKYSIFQRAKFQPGKGHKLSGHAVRKHSYMLCEMHCHLAAVHEV